MVPSEKVCTTNSSVKQRAVGKRCLGHRKYSLATKGSTSTTGSFGGLQLDLRFNIDLASQVGMEYTVLGGELHTDVARIWLSGEKELKVMKRIRNIF